jgi:glycosyltransferase involved in cell wall biosynthesis
MKRLLLINNGYPSKEYPNYTTWAASIGRCLELAGFKVDLLVIQYKKLNFFNKAKKYLQYFLRLITKDTSRYEVVYINYPTHALPIFLNRTLNIDKVYFHWHGYDLMLIRNYIHNRIAHKLLKPIIKRCRHFVPSSHYKNELIRKFQVKAENIVISPSGGVNIHQFSPLKPKQKGNKFVIGFASGLAYEKGLGLLYDIMLRYKIIEDKINSPVEFSIINYAQDAAAFIKDINEKKIPVDIWRKMNKGDMHNFFNVIDILLMTSESESLGLVALEAMSCNKPVITYDICAFPDFVIPSVSGERVILTSNRTINAGNFIEAIIRVKSNYALYAPREIVVKYYSEESVVECYKKVLDAKYG